MSSYSVVLTRIRTVTDGCIGGEYLGNWWMNEWIDILNIHFGIY